MAIIAPRLFKMDVRSGTAGAANGEPEIKTSKISKHFVSNNRDVWDKRYNSPVEKQNDLELDFKVFLCVDSCC